jgi:hypothetical protein
LADAKAKEKNIGTTSQPIFRTPLVLFAILDLALLGTRLWPWQNVLSLPDNGATGIDPAVSLAAYIGLALLIGRTRTPTARKSLFTSGLLGVVGGLLLSGYVFVSGQAETGDVTPSQYMQIGLLMATAVLWGLAGLRASRAKESFGWSVVCATWSALVSCTIAFAAAVGQVYVIAAPSESSDPWKQYEGLALGSAATQSLVHSLNTATGFLLIGPLVALLTGALFAYLGRPRSS